MSVTKTQMRNCATALIAAILLADGVKGDHHYCRMDTSCDCWDEAAKTHDLIDEISPESGNVLVLTTPGDMMCELLGTDLELSETTDLELSEMAQKCDIDDKTEMPLFREMLFRFEGKAGPGTVFETDTGHKWVWEERDINSDGSLEDILAFMTPESDSNTNDTWIEIGKDEPCEYPKLPENIEGNRKLLQSIDIGGGFSPKFGSVKVKPGKVSKGARGLLKLFLNN